MEPTEGRRMDGDMRSGCACVVVGVRLSIGNRGNSERETWTLFSTSKIRFWSGVVTSIERACAKT